jgi:hypothetical protein
VRSKAIGQTRISVRSRDERERAQDRNDCGSDEVHGERLARGCRIGQGRC